MQVDFEPLTQDGTSTRLQSSTFIGSLGVGYYRTSNSHHIMYPDGYVFGEFFEGTHTIFNETLASLNFADN